MPGGLRVTRLVRIAMERIEHDGVGAEQMQLREVIDDLVDCSLTGEAPAGGDGFSVSRRAIRGTRPGTGRWCSPATPVIRSTASRSQGIVTPSGCQPSPRRTARRMPASLLPPTHIGIRPPR